MAKTYVFAIGGTGARVLRSLSMLMAAGIPGFDSTTEICPLIIDYDLHNGDKDRAITCLKQYEAVRNYIAAGKPERDGFFTGKITNLDFLENYSWMFKVEDENLKFSDYIGYDYLNNKSPFSKYLIDSLYDTDKNKEYNELYINMKVGFQGNPNIGSVVFDKLKECQEFKAFKDQFNSEKDKVVIIGSVFGGTGSSGIPKIVTAIHNESASPDLKKADIASILVLPYFIVGTADKDIAVKSAIFNSKTKAALNYYEKSGLNKLINTIYYIGDKIPMSVEPHLGGSEQKNNAHPVELIAAMAVAHYTLKNPQVVDYKEAQLTQYKFNTANDSENGITMTDFVGQANQNDFFVKSMIHNIINFTFAMRYFADEIVDNKNPKRFKDTQYYKELKLNEIKEKALPSSRDGRGHTNLLQDFCATLYKFYCLQAKDATSDGYVQWLKELHSDKHGIHRLCFFNINSQKIKDLVIECSMEKETSVMLGLGESIKELLNYENTFDSCMNNAFTDKGHYVKGKGVQREQVCYPWILADLLHETGEEIRDFNDDLKAKFTTLP